MVIDFDVMDIFNFIDSLCIWLDCENVWDNEIMGVRLDFEYLLGGDIFSSI